MGIQLFRGLIAYLKPILPAMAQASESFLQCEPLNWENMKKPLSGQIANFTPLKFRIEQAKIDAVLAQK
jgi:methionyl-tRNA synthetase